MTRLSLALLGPFSATLDNQPIKTFDSVKVRVLLAYLAVEADRAHAREVLAGLLWPDWPQRSALSNLRYALANLRRAIGDGQAQPPFLVISRDTIQFNLASDHWLDVAAFTQTVETPSSSPETLEQAVAWFRSGFMDGFSVRDSPVMEDWIRLRREQLDRLRLNALGRLADSHAQQGQYDSALTNAWQRMGLDSLNEEGHQQLIRLLALNGERTAALAEHERFRQLLSDTLGVAPATATQALVDAIRAGRIDRTRPVTILAAEPPFRNLPIQTTPLVGRERELAELAQYLAEPTIRLISLLGPGGVGKTRLALAAAEAQLASRQDPHPFPHGVFFIPLASLDTSDLLVPTVAKGIGLQFYEGGEPKAQLLSYLREKAALLILDNVEHLLAGVELVDELLKTAPGIKLLVTSREKLNRQAEQLVWVGGLSYPEDDDNTACDGSAGTGHSAIQLFLQTARRVQPGFALTAENGPHVARVCRLMQGMPLGIVLAAAWVETLTPKEIVDEIGQDLDFLATEKADMPARLRSPRAAFDHSWRLLAPREQEAFAKLSVFRGGFARPAAHAVTDASLRDLQALVGKSLLNHTSAGRYEVHELLRQFAAEKLAANESVETAARNRHGDWYLGMLREHEADLRGPRAKGALQELEADNDNIQTAWNWMAHRGNVAPLGQAAFSLAAFYLRSGRFRVGQAAFGVAVEAVSRHISEASGPVSLASRVLALLLAWQSEMLFALGSTGAAEASGLKALSVLDAPELQGQDTRAERAIVHLALGRVYEWLDRQPDVTQHLEASIDLSRSVGDRWRMADAIHLLGGVAQRSGAYELGIQRGLEAEAHYLALGDQHSAAYNRMWVRNLQAFLWPTRQAKDLIRQSLVYFREFGDQSAEAWALFGLGMASMGQGHFGEARTLFSESIALCDRLGMTNRSASIHFSWQEAAMHQGEFDLVSSQLSKQLASDLEAASTADVAKFHFVDGSIRLVQGRCAEAKRLLSESRRIFHGIRRREEAAMAGAVLSCAYACCGDGTLAKQALAEALRFGQELRTFAAALHVLPAAALLLAQLADSERAVELYALASRYTFVANSRWFRDTVGQSVEVAAAALPVAVVQAAKERGCALDLWPTMATLLDDLGMGTSSNPAGTGPGQNI